MVLEGCSTLAVVCADGGPLLTPIPNPPVSTPGASSYTSLLPFSDHKSVWEFQGLPTRGGLAGLHKQIPPLELQIVSWGVTTPSPPYVVAPNSLCEVKTLPKEHTIGVGSRFYGCQGISQEIPHELCRGFYRRFRLIMGDFQGSTLMKDPPLALHFNINLVTKPPSHHDSASEPPPSIQNVTCQLPPLQAKPKTPNQHALQILLTMSEQNIGGYQIQTFPCRVASTSSLSRAALELRLSLKL